MFASFQPYPVFVLQFALTIIHRSRRVAKNREGLGEFITSDVRYM